MTSSKRAFGAFVIAKRQAASLTQRELAERLFVTESAVSKWERGVSYPDISLVAALARELHVTETELIHASDDLAGRQVEHEARLLRRWRAAIRWSTTIAYAVALVTCFIVNLAVAHTLDWFWVVLAALAVAASLTTLPLLRLEHRGWTVLAAFLISLVALLAIVRALYGGGDWLAIAVSAVLFAALLVFSPLALAAADLPVPVAHHRTVLALGADTLGLVLLLLVIFATRGDLGTLVARALPTAGLAVVFAWVPALVIRYLPIPRLARVAVAVAFVGVYQFFPFRALVNGGEQSPADLSRWDESTINGNVALLTLLGSLLVAAILAAAAGLRTAHR